MSPHINTDQFKHEQAIEKSISSNGIIFHTKKKLYASSCFPHEHRDLFKIFRLHKS